MKKETEVKTEDVDFQKELEEQKKLADEYLDHLKRLQAEFQNYQKRVVREQEEFTKFAKKELIAELLHVVDNFERALNNINDEGVKLIHNQLVKILEKEGVKEIEALGLQFDPNLHEALAQEESDKKEGEIIEVFEKGYQLHDRVIRPSKVKVSGEKNEKNNCS